MLSSWLTKNTEPEPGRETEPTLDDSVHYIEWLMAWYCRKPSVMLANVIVERLETLRSQVQQGDILDPQWSCMRLAQSWEHIAERNRTRLQ